MRNAVPRTATSATITWLINQPGVLGYQLYSGGHPLVPIYADGSCIGVIDGNQERYTESIRLIYQLGGRASLLALRALIQGRST